MRMTSNWNNLGVIYLFVMTKYYLCTEDDHVWNGQEFSEDYVPRLFQTYEEANRVRQRLYKSYDCKIMILEWY